LRGPDAESGRSELNDVTIGGHLSREAELLSDAVAQGLARPILAMPALQNRTNSQQNQDVNTRFVKQFTDRIQGRENEPAAQVFKNIQIPWLKTVEARTFLGIMNGGYGLALGVQCTHCHVEEDFSSDEKRPKRAAREMARMHRMINEQLERMENLETSAPDRSINCATCHRGAVSPLAADR
jgi:Photosynthetic reaction centre cytochrome C subunit